MTFILSEHPALGTQWWIEIFSDISPEQIEIIKVDLTTTISDFENKYSRFKSDSLLSQLNTEGLINNPDREFVNILTYGQSLYTKTDGKFNILIGEELIARGYDAEYSFKTKPSPTKIPNPLTDLVITDSKIELKAGSVDIGGFGKGYLIDLLAERLKKHFNIEEFLINGGGDIYTTSENGQPITIHLEHPTEAGTYVGTTTLQNQGFAASSPHKRKWKINDKTYNHIVGGSDRDLQIDGVFVKANTATEADSIATTSLLLNPEEIPTLATKTRTAIAYMKNGESTLFHVNGF
jgi:thiamine biosynthesis lipoprotein